MSTTPPERDWDAEFAEITAALDDISHPRPDVRPSRQWQFVDPEEPSAPEPEPASNAASSGPLASTLSEPSGPDAEPTPAVASGVGAHRAASHEVEETDPEDDFVPPTPEPLQADDPATTIMLASFVLGPLWLAYLALFAPDTRTLWWVVAALVCVLGLVLAIARQPKSRDEDDPDDGARV